MRVQVKSVLAFINRGGFGRVERVLLGDDQIAARKVFDPEPTLYSSEAELQKLRTRFSREVRYQKTLAAHGAMPIIDEETSGDNPWFIMPLAEMSYADRIREDRSSSRVTPEPLLDILAGLERLHELGFVHRDLKPENVLLHDGVWRLSDFGLAAHQDAGKTSRITTQASNWGTMSYMPPEQATGFKNATAAADIYAFGCILHELLDGRVRVPYAVQSVPGPFDPIVRKCTATDPLKRFKSIAGLRAVLLNVLRKDASIGRDAVTVEWAGLLDTIREWPSERVDQFVSHISTVEAGSELHVISDLDSERLLALAERAPEEWEAIATAYCDWARGAFTWYFCDAVVERLETIYNHRNSSLSVRASACTAAATLGARHNRFFVMKRLIHMCGVSIDDHLATRIALEIHANELHADFKHCAREVWGWSMRDLHPTIREAVENQEA